MAGPLPQPAVTECRSFSEVSTDLSPQILSHKVLAMLEKRPSLSTSYLSHADKGIPGVHACGIPLRMHCEFWHEGTVRECYLGPCSLPRHQLLAVGTRDGPDTHTDKAALLLTSGSIRINPNRVEFISLCVRCVSAFILSNLLTTYLKGQLLASFHINM